MIMMRRRINTDDDMLCTATCCLPYCTHLDCEDGAAENRSNKSGTEVRRIKCFMSAVEWYGYMTACIAQ